MIDKSAQGLRVAVAVWRRALYDISDLLDEWMKPRMSRRANAALLAEQYPVDQRQDRFRRSAQEQTAYGQRHQPGAAVSSLPYHADVLVNPSFSASINGSPLALTGDSKPFGKPMKASSISRSGSFRSGCVAPFAGFAAFPPARPGRWIPK